MKNITIILMFCIIVVLSYSCDKNPENNNVANHIGNWEPVTIYIKQYDENGAVEIDSDNFNQKEKPGVRPALFFLIKISNIKFLPSSISPETVLPDLSVSGTVW